MARKTWALFDEEGGPRMLVTALERKVAEDNLPQEHEGWEVLRMPDGTRNLVGLTKEQAVAEDS